MTLQTWVNVPSKALAMRTSLIVITPEGDGFNPVARPEGADPGLLILLHGLTANASMWPIRDDLLAHASKHNLVIALPDGERSFWLNQAHGLRWGEWVGAELPDILRRTLRVSTRKEDTYIGGFSMGGYGAFHAALDYPQTFGAAFSLSGVLDVAEDGFANRHPDLFTTGFGNPSVPRPEDDLVARVRAGDGRTVKLFAACGEGDRLHSQNLTFLDAAEESGLDLTWKSAPGVHNFRFWNEWLPKALDAVID